MRRWRRKIETSVPFLFASFHSVIRLVSIPNCLSRASLFFSLFFHLMFRHESRRRNKFLGWDMESNVREEEEEVLNRTRLPSSSSSKKILQCKDQWGWDVNQKSSEVTIFGRKGQTALFHSTWSSGSVSSLTFRTIDFLPDSLLVLILLRILFCL